MCLRTKCQELGIITKKDCSRGFLVVILITRIEHFDSWLSIWLRLSWCDTIARGTCAEINCNDVSELTIFQ